jgi:hypothetical protein
VKFQILLSVAESSAERWGKYFETLCRFMSYQIKGRDLEPGGGAWGTRVQIVVMPIPVDTTASSE